MSISKEDFEELVNDSKKELKAESEIEQMEYLLYKVLKDGSQDDAAALAATLKATVYIYEDMLDELMDSIDIEGGDE